MERVYPAPTIVVGVGRFGLAVLERLGEDWQGLKLSGADETVRNLRLMSVRPDDVPAKQEEAGRPEQKDEPDACWRKREQPAARVAHLMGDGDLPSRALDFAVLRSLGLVRFRDGIYQLGLPRDDGPVEIREEQGESRARTMRRRRYFDWLGLGSDPIVAAERLRQTVERRQDVDLFVTPLLNRVRQGHSPRAVLATLARCIALHDGLDPCPWEWLRKRLGSERGDEVQVAERQLAVDESMVVDQEAEEQDGDSASSYRFAHRNEQHLFSAPEPLKGWRRWLKHRAEVSGSSLAEPTIHIPWRFQPQGSVPVSPIDPKALLGRDWRVSSWAGEESLAEREEFLPVPATSFRLGFFDHDSRTAGQDDNDRVNSVDEQLGERLKELGQQVHRGLIRLWVDLQRTRASGAPGQGARRERSREHLGDTLQQCLEVLGELVIRPLASPRDSDEGTHPTAAPRPKSRVEQRLPVAPSRFLSGMLVDQQTPDDPLHRLDVRLEEMGLLESEALEAFRQPLLTDVRLSPADIEEIERNELFGELHPEPKSPAPAEASQHYPGEHASRRASEPADPTDDSLMAGRATSGTASPPKRTSISSRAGIQDLRRTLNHLVRQLYDFSHLARSRRRPTRQPPRLTVAVVGDMSEPFSRAALRPILREVHAELLRAFTPIFQAYREGYDRSLCVTPILWMPHPADPFKGESLSQTRCEEAAIIDTVHGIRHWVECVLPPGRRFIPQIFINSRVTDISTLTLREAIRQTRDFLSLQLRNDLSDDPWLRRISSGSGQDDLFSSFACREIDFPALRCREYLANRLARDLLGQLKHGGERPRDSIDEERLGRFEPPDRSSLVSEPSTALQRITANSGEQRRQDVETACRVDLRTWAQEIEKAYDPGFQQRLQWTINTDWRELTGRRGEVDERVDYLRIQIADELDRRLGDLRRQSNRLIEENLREDGLRAALAGFEQLHRKARDLFRSQETHRSDCEELARRHTMPDRPYANLDRRRRQIEKAAREKPDLLPMRTGLVAWACLSAVLGAPLAHGLAYYFELHRNPGLLELLLGPMGMLTGGLVLFLSGWGLLRWHLRRRTREVCEAIGSMATEAKRLLAGSENRLSPKEPFSIRSFLESRVELTAAVALRGFSARILERALADGNLAHRLVRSVDVQAHRLQRRAEDLGVRKRPGEGPEAEDLSRLLGTGSQERRYLIGENELKEYYRTHIPREEDLRAELTRFLPAAGGTEGWRERACLSDTESILNHGRDHFRNIALHAASEQYSFAETLGPGLLHLVDTCYSTLGFGAEFRGFEGLDPDGIHVVTDAGLVLHPDLARVFRKARDRDDAPPTTRTMQVKEVPTRPNAAYMLSLVQGIRVHSVRNLKRFESFHDRIRMPDDRTFPLTQETPDEAEDSPRPVNLVSAYEGLARNLEAAIHRRNGVRRRENER